MQSILRAQCLSLVRHRPKSEVVGRSAASLLGMRDIRSLHSGKGETQRFGSIQWRTASHNGVDVVVEKNNPEQFKADLAKAVEMWREEGRKAVWLSLDIDDMHLCKPAHELGFTFHNAKGNEADMLLWLPKHIPNKVPPFGFHQVGVGALVFNPRNEILLVKERMKRIDRWKMPGGLIDPGETIAQAAQREVFEETGVNAKFHSVLAFWQRTLTEHTSDIYFVSRLTVMNDEDAKIAFDPHEISECTWMPLKEYVENHSHPMLLSVLNKNFGISAPEDLAALDNHGPLLPEMELARTKLVMYPSAAAFETFLVKNPRGDRHHTQLSSSMS